MDSPHDSRPTSLDDLLRDARSGLKRVAAADLAEAMDRGAIVIDHRDTSSIRHEGVLPGSLIIPRSVLEWRLAPTSDWRALSVDATTEIVLVCNDGCSSSLAAAGLQSLGLEGATDLIGGFRAWVALQGS